MERKEEETGWWDIWSMSSHACSLLASAGEMLRRSKEVYDIAKRVQLQREAMSLQMEALKVLHESDRLVIKRIHQQKIELERQRAVGLKQTGQ